MGRWAETPRFECLKNCVNANYITQYVASLFFLTRLKSIINITMSSKISEHFSVGASSQCYCYELMLLKCELMLLKCELLLLKCELMLLKCQFNTNTKKKDFFIYQFPKTMFADFFVLILDLNSIRSHWEAAPTAIQSSFFLLKCSD